MGVQAVRDMAADADLRARATEALGPLERWTFQCHAASIHLVRAGLGDRVARGAGDGVGGQHSWVVFGDPYAPETIVDPTLWSYDESVDGVWVGGPGRHHPHGAGSIWQWGRPENASGEEFKLTPREPFSREAQNFLDLLGPMDRNGWITLAHAPVERWPAGEIIAAICDSGLEGYVPIDIVGMVTDRNPAGLYLP